MIIAAVPPSLEATGKTHEIYVANATLKPTEQ